MKERFAAAALGVGLMVGGCSAGNEAQPQPTPPATVASPSPEACDRRPFPVYDGGFLVHTEGPRAGNPVLERQELDVLNGAINTMNAHHQRYDDIAFGMKLTGVAEDAVYAKEVAADNGPLRLATEVPSVIIPNHVMPGVQIIPPVIELAPSSDYPELVIPPGIGHVMLAVVAARDCAASPQGPK